MPKKILFESAVHQFLSAAHAVQAELVARRAAESQAWRQFVASLRFAHLPNGEMEVRWTSPSEGCALVSYREASFYVRGDTGEHVHTQQQQGLAAPEDAVMQRNQRLFTERVRELATRAGLNVAVPR